MRIPKVGAELAATLLLVALTGCGGGGDSSNPPQSPAPPTPVPPAPPPPPPPGGSILPPLSATIVDLTDNHAVGVSHWPSGNTSDGGSGSPVQGIDCNDPPVETYHVHTHVSIFLNGEQLAVPGQVGIVSTGPSTDCHYEIHTHDSSGKIHVEAPASGVFTLGQLFAIWGQPLESANVAGLMNMPVVIYLTDNGVAAIEEGDPKAIELKSHREITIQVGTAIPEIPRYTWNGN